MESVDAQVASLRAHRDAVATQLSVATVASAERYERLHQLQSRANALRADAEATRVRAATIRAETRAATAAAAVASDLQQMCEQRRGALRVATARVAVLQRRCDRGEADEAQAHAAALAELRDMTAVLESLAARARDVRCRAEERFLSADANGTGSGASVAAAAALVAAVQDVFSERELALRDALNDADYRADESSRFDRDVAALEQRAQADLEAVAAAKTAQREALTAAFARERRRLHDGRSAQLGIAKETEFHARRGTLVKRSDTRPTPLEEQLQRRVADGQDRARQMQSELDAVVAERLVLERTAERDLDRLVQRRAQFTAERDAAKQRLDERRQFGQALRAERAAWMAVRGDMREIVQEVRDAKHSEGAQRVLPVSSSNIK